ncbi:hypothetical protein C8R45DRAFT_1148932 [Mycena sanguinolenta]|nr:hypothetical protein C8R45DRAFT_1148932 [Mycena sanguinolenta]
MTAELNVDSQPKTMLELSLGAALLLDQEWMVSELAGVDHSAVIRTTVNDPRSAGQHTIEQPLLAKDWSPYPQIFLLELDSALAVARESRFDGLDFQRQFSDWSSKSATQDDSVKSGSVPTLWQSGRTAPLESESAADGLRAQAPTLLAENVPCYGRRRTATPGRQCRRAAWNDVARSETSRPTMPPHPNHPNNTPITFVPRARYSPPRNRLNSEMGIVDATTLILLQKMMADSYEHGRVVWKENRARCARTGEAESDALPCGPNPAQKKVEAWLVEAGLLAPDVPDEPESDEDLVLPESTMPLTPQTPRRRPWYRRLEIVIPRKSNNRTLSESSASISVDAVPSASMKSPRSPPGLSPIKLWSGVAAIPVPVVRPKLKPKPTRTESPSLAPPRPTVTATVSPFVERPVRRKCASLSSTPVPVPASVSDKALTVHDTLLTTAFKRAVMLETITDDDVEAILCRHRNPLPPPRTMRTPATPTLKSKAKPFDDPTWYPIRWPEPSPPSSSALNIDITPSQAAMKSPDVRWYHLLFLVFLWHFLIIALSVYVVLRVALRPLMCLAVVYCAVVWARWVVGLF